MFFLILLFSFGVICFGFAGIPIMFDKGIGYFIYALFMEFLLIALVLVCIKKYRNPTYQEKLKLKKQKIAYKIIYKSLQVLSVLLAFILALAICLPDKNIENSVNDESSVESNDESQEEKQLSFLDDFTEYGYSAEQIEDMRTILINVGITEITELEITPVSYGMQTVKGLAYKDTSFLADQNDEVQVQFNIENGKIYLVMIYCPSYYSENKPTYLSGLTDRRADLYYDVEGGYLKKIDWKNKAVIDY